MHGGAWCPHFLDDDAVQVAQLAQRKDDLDLKQVQRSSGGAVHPPLPFPVQNLIPNMILKHTHRISFGGFVEEGNYKDIAAFMHLLTQAMINRETKGEVVSDGAVTGQWSFTVQRLRGGGHARQKSRPR